MATRDWDLFQGLPPSEVDSILTLATTRFIPEGSTLFDLGDAATGVFLVEKGLIRLTLPLKVGDRDVDAMVGEREPGHMVGWSGLIPPHQFTVKAVAFTDTYLLALARSSVFAHFREKPEVGYRIFANLAQVVGQRLQVFQTLWIREMQHVVKKRTS